MDDLTLKAMKDFAEINKTLPGLSDSLKIYKDFSNLKAILPDPSIFQLITSDRVVGQELFSNLRVAHTILDNLAITQSLFSTQQLLADSSIMTRMLPDFSVMKKILSDFSATQLAVSNITASHLKIGFEAISLSQISLANLSWGKIGEAINANYKRRATISSKFLNFSNSYFHLYQSLDQISLKATSIPSLILELPTVELFNGTDLLEAISNNDDEDQYITMRQNLRYEISKQATDTLEILLAEIDRNLINMWRGAVQSLNSNNEDYIRHFLISLRELFTHVVHKLAPDADVSAWTTSSEHFHNGRPTRKARILFICRDINFDPFSTFIEKDIASVLSLWDVFNRTHELAITLSQNQLTALKIRTEGALRLLLEIWKSSR